MYSGAVELVKTLKEAEDVHAVDIVAFSEGVAIAVIVRTAFHYIQLLLGRVSTIILIIIIMK